jgi:hypothetical protein
MAVPAAMPRRPPARAHQPVHRAAGGGAAGERRKANLGRVLWSNMMAINRSAGQSGCPVVLWLAPSCQKREEDYKYKQFSPQ